MKHLKRIQRLSAIPGWYWEKEWLPFEEARNFARNLKLENHKEWKDYCKSGKKPDDIPVAPQSAYRDKGWISWGEFLGTGYIASQNRKYKTYEEARKFVRSLKLKNTKEWNDYYKSGKKPDDIPASPWRVYKDKGWISLSDFLGTDYIANQNREYKTFKKTRKIIRPLKFKNREE